MKKIYIAAPLFSEADRVYNELVTRKIEAIKSNDGLYNSFNCYLPQRNEAINDKTNFADSIMIYEGDTSKLAECDILVCLLDGTVVDPGVAAEIGWVAGFNSSNNKKKKIIGLFTDSRDGTNTPASGNIQTVKASALYNGIAESQFSYINLYVIGAVKKYGTIVKSTPDLINELEKIKEE